MGPLRSIHPSIQSTIIAGAPTTDPSFTVHSARFLVERRAASPSSHNSIHLASVQAQSSHRAGGRKGRAGKHEPVRVPRISCGVGADFCQSLHDGAPMSTLSLSPSPFLQSCSAPCILTSASPARPSYRSLGGPRFIRFANPIGVLILHIRILWWGRVTRRPKQISLRGYLIFTTSIWNLDP